MLEKIKCAADYVRSQVAEMPKVAIILGTGLGELVNHINIQKEIQYNEIPSMPVSTVEGHSGKLILVILADVMLWLCRVVFTITRDTT